jgi:N-acetylmuramoyl-L-alanine amidase
MLALVIGHSKKSKGAYNKDSKLYEFDFNEKLVHDISNILKINHVIIYRRTYKDLPKDINELNPSHVISFHCNAFNTKATGTETLYYHKSSKGEQIANILQNKIVEILGLSDRGIKSRTTEDRGGYLLRYTNAPCVIIEPFFIDNNEDLKTARSKYNQLVQGFVDALEEVSRVPTY